MMRVMRYAATNKARYGVARYLPSEMAIGFYRPMKDGFLFSRKAVRPSITSWLDAH